jgi:cation diffusion facilitator family transporter
MPHFYYLDMQKNYLTRAGIALAILLLGLKLWASIATKSMAVLSDALNSFLDIFSYSVIHFSVQLHDTQADKNHPFGHRRAEPLAGLIIAIFAGILGATIIKDSFLGIFEEHKVYLNNISIGIMIFAIISKIIIASLYKIFAKKYNSPALDASFVDSRNDVFASSIAILGMIVGGYLDHIAGLLIGIWIIYSGASLGFKNLKFLMGHIPPKEIMESIEKEAMKIHGVIGFNDLRAHYVGDVIHVELHIEVDDQLSVRDAHDIGITVRDKLEALPIIQKAFIHIDPISDIE